VLWVLADIHWGDASTWAFVRYAARRVGDLGLVLAVTYRDEEFGPWHRWWQGLLRLKQEPLALHLPLARLTAADGEQLVRAIAPALPSDVVTEIIKRAAGTPLLLAELASLSEPGAPPGQPLPVSDIVRATVDERKNRLGKQGRALLETAAVAGDWKWIPACSVRSLRKGTRMTLSPPACSNGYMPKATDSGTPCSRRQRTRLWSAGAGVPWTHASPTPWRRAESTLRSRWQLTWNGPAEPRQRYQCSGRRQPKRPKPGTLDGRPKMCCRCAARKRITAP
jgi:hypothetical protein